MYVPPVRYQTLVEHHAGTEELIYALMDFPDAVETLWKTMVEKDLEAVKMAVESEYDYFITWEDSSTQNYSPTQYDRYIGSEIGQWCRILNDAGKHYVQHACGHVAALVERMVNHGTHTIESISPPPTGNIGIAETRAKVGDRLGIIGGIEPTQFLNLSLEGLAEYVESVLADGAGGPFVLANSDSCPPGVTVEKFKLVADIARSSAALKGGNVQTVVGGDRGDPVGRAGGVAVGEAVRAGGDGGQTARVVVTIHGGGEGVKPVFEGVAGGAAEG